MMQKENNKLVWSALLGALVAFVLAGYALYRADTLVQQGLMGAGVSNFDRVQLDGTTNPVLDLTGGCMDLDDDNDTSICADTDDQIDIEISGADDFRFTANTFTILSGSTMSISGTFDLNGVADALILDADGDTTISADTDDQINLELNSVDHVVLKAVATADAAATTNIAEIAFTAPVDTTGTNTHNALNIDVEIGNASGGTNAVNAIAIDNTTGDAQVTETGILLGTGYDIGLDAQGMVLDLDTDNDTSITASTDDQIDLELGGVDHVVLKGVATADAGATTNIAEIAFTSPVDTTGTNVHNALNIDIEIGNASGGTNSVNALAIDNISGDTEVTETAVLIGTGYDVGVDLQGVSMDLDADNDTSIAADTDDQIDIEISGADDFQFTANTFTVLAGSKINPQNATNGGAVFSCENTVAFSDTSNKTMCVIPANANIVDFLFVVTTAFNSSGTDQLNCGTTSGDPDEYVDSLDGEVAGINRMGDAADMALTDAPGDVGGSDIVILCKFVQGVADANAGAARLVMLYSID